MSVLVDRANRSWCFNSWRNVIVILLALVIVLWPKHSRAEEHVILDVRFSGIYQVVASSDPAFPHRDRTEWFMDFGNGTSTGKTSGKVAISMRQNPKVRVNIMAWEYFPRMQTLALGNQFHEGAKNAVAFGSWKIVSSSGGVQLERGAYQITLHRLEESIY